MGYTVRPDERAEGRRRARGRGRARPLALVDRGRAHRRLRQRRARNSHRRRYRPIDPLPLRAAALERLGRVSAICLTCGSHQRSAWRLRRELGIEVHAPALVREVDEEPDVRYQHGDVLPGGLQAIFTPGAGTTQHALLLDGATAVLFTADLFVHPAAGGAFDFVPDEFLYDPPGTRESARRLLDVPFDVLCLGHGRPITADPKAAIRALLERRP